MIEILIVAALVIWSAVVVFKKVFPTTSGSDFMSLSALCEARGWTRLATWLRPSMAGGCGGNCACPAPEDSHAKRPDVKAVKGK